MASRRDPTVPDTAAGQLDELVRDYARLSTRISLLRDDVPRTEAPLLRLLWLRDRIGQEISALRRRLFLAPTLHDAISMPADPPRQGHSL